MVLVISTSTRKHQAIFPQHFLGFTSNIRPAPRHRLFCPSWRMASEITASKTATPSFALSPGSSYSPRESGFAWQICTVVPAILLDVALKVYSAFLGYHWHHMVARISVSRDCHCPLALEIRSAFREQAFRFGGLVLWAYCCESVLKMVVSWACKFKYAVHTMDLVSRGECSRDSGLLTNPWRFIRKSI
jgi:hypothetical protein